LCIEKEKKLDDKMERNRGENHDTLHVHCLSFCFGKVPVATCTYLGSQYQNPYARIRTAAEPVYCICISTRSGAVERKEKTNNRKGAP
jgi:hypothetical protein